MNENKERKRKGKKKAKKDYLGKLVFVCLVFFPSVSLKPSPQKGAKKALKKRRLILLLLLLQSN